MGLVVAMVSLRDSGLPLGLDVGERYDVPWIWRMWYHGLMKQDIMQARSVPYFTLGMWRCLNAVWAVALAPLQ